MFLNVYSTKVDSVMDSVYDRVSTKVDFRKVDAAIKNLVDHSDYMERTLKDKKNLVGDKLTIADIALVCVFEPFIRFACCPK
jgi:glutathione S-transferase